MIAVLHDINLASQYADKLFFLKEGHLAAQGSPNEIITREILFDVFQTETTSINNPISSTALVLYNPAAKGAS